MTTNQQKLRELINKANPELLELKKGCKLYLMDGEYIEGEVFEITDIGPHHLGIYVDGNSWDLNDKGDFESIKQEVSYLEILGKDPTLEHLLIALGNKNTNIRDMFLYKNHFLDIELDELDTWTAYDLTKPPLEQSEETLTELIKLLS